MTDTVLAHSEINYGKFFSQYASYFPIFSPLHSIIKREQYVKHPTINEATTDITENSLVGDVL